MKHTEKEITKLSMIQRDISWLSFNARVLQEANDDNVPLHTRLKFLGIFSNNLDEFFRVRVATLNRMIEADKNTKMAFESNPLDILKQIQIKVLSQQKDFEVIYENVLKKLKEEKVSIVNESQLSSAQQKFVDNYFNDKVRTHISPLMIESIPELAPLNDKSIYLACVLANQDNSFMNSYALIEVPTKSLPRFIILPAQRGMNNIILLEDVIRYSLPKLFNQFGFDLFEGYIIKVTRDAELDIDNDVQTNIIQKLEKGLKNRKRGKAIRLVYDKAIQRNLLEYLIKLLGLGKRSHLVAGGRIHNFKDFMNFPTEIFEQKLKRGKPFVHPLLKQPIRILDVLQKQDVMLHFPYHSFDSIIDLLREAAIDPLVEVIKITCYRLAKDSKIANALINAVRNGKKVTVVIELRARFDEEANLYWKKLLEDEGAEVIVGSPHCKIHAKLCLITKRVNKLLVHYGFVSTGNLNEDTAKVYGDHCLLTADKRIVADIVKMFHFIKNQNNIAHLKACKYLIASPYDTRNFFISRIHHLTRNKKSIEQSSLIIKLNSLSDKQLIHEISLARRKGLDIKLIVRGICCLPTESAYWKSPITALSIVDEYLEHARVISFKYQDKHEMYISSADWMLRNLDYRIEASVPIFSKVIQKELDTILEIQLQENQKARILDNSQKNEYVKRKAKEKIVRSQIEIYNFLNAQEYNQSD